MVSLGNRFYRGIVHNPKGYVHPNFRFILVDTVYEKQDENGEWYTDSFENYRDYLLHNPDHGEVFYGVYGSYWSDLAQTGLKITETINLQEAIRVAQEIMGNHIIETAIPKS